MSERPSPVVTSVSPAAQAARTIAVRFEGGIGDHILGLRVLPFLRRRYPEHEIVGCSDAGGHRSPLQALELSPWVDRVRPVLRLPVTGANWGALHGILPEHLAEMRAADSLVNVWSEDLFVTAAREHQLPLFEILAVHPLLRIPPEARARAARWLAPFAGQKVVALNLLAADKRRSILPPDDRLLAFVQATLADPDVVMLNILMSSCDFPHLPFELRVERQEIARREVQWLRAFSRSHTRIVHCEDEDVKTTAALLSECHYFIGVDNGIKHLAWALGVPHTFFLPREPEIEAIFRWMPDIHRLLQQDSPPHAYARHLDDVRAALARRL